MILAHIHRSFRQTFIARASEWALAVILINWGWVLTLNDTLFVDGPSFSRLGDLFPQPTWAWVCFALGLSRIVVLGINGAWRRSPHLRAFMAFLSCFFWLQITLGFWQSGTNSTGLAVYPVLFALDFINVIRAMQDARLADDALSGG